MSKITEFEQLKIIVKDKGLCKGLCSECIYSQKYEDNRGGRNCVPQHVSENDTSIVWRYKESKRLLIKMILND